ncbi:MAG: nitroreductase family protein [Actinomycetota bacterium]|nr:nitroreductase family protein [Actinomycetota bacterium]
MDFQQVVRRRRMVRSFEDRPLPAKVVESLVTNAQRGPSAGFSQGVEFLVLNGKDETARYWDVSLPAGEREGFPWPGLLNAPLIIVPFAHPATYLNRYAEPDKARRSGHAGRSGRSGHAGRSGRSGHAGRDPAPWPVPYWHVDAAFASLLVLLTAVDAGVGALFFRVFRPEAVRAAFGVPDGYLPVGAIAVGYPAPEGDRPSSSALRGRRPPADVVHRGRW